MFSSNPQVQLPGGTIPNMHIPAWNITVPLHLQDKQELLIDMNTPYVSQGPMANCVANEIPQQRLAQSIWAPNS